MITKKIKKHRLYRDLEVNRENKVIITIEDNKNNKRMNMNNNNRKELKAVDKQTVDYKKEKKTQQTVINFINSNNNKNKFKTLKVMTMIKKQSNNNTNKSSMVLSQVNKLSNIVITKGDKTTRRRQTLQMFQMMKNNNLKQMMKMDLMVCLRN